MRPDDSLVAAQLGRAPRGRWRVAARCGYGNPRVIAISPFLGGGERFPTTFWLTCPHLAAAVHDEESSGACREWAARIANDLDLAAKVLVADADYREARRREGGGGDPCSDVGVAGQAEPLAVKCLHARLAATLADCDDPVGAEVAERLASRLGLDCTDRACGTRGTTA